jgi:predicted transcriptional regulator
MIFDGWKMELPQEIELWYVIPAIRKAMMAELRQRGLKQKQIAPLLGITEAAISQYMRDKRATQCCDAFEKTPLKEAIKHAVNIIIEQEKEGPAVAVREINRICKLVRETKTICTFHRKKNPEMNECNICYEK